MPWTVIIPALIQGASMLGQYFNSQDAQEKSAEEQQYMQDLLAKVQDPQFDASNLTPQDIQYLGDFNPEIPKLVEQHAPQLMQGTAVGNRARDSQVNAISQQQQLMQAGRDPIAEIQQAQAQRKAAADAQSIRESSLQDEQRRGVGGGGMAYMNALQRMQGSLQNEALAGEQGVIDAQNRRSQAGMNVGQLASNLRGQEMSQEEKNANIINEFNRNLAAQGQAYQNNIANIQNQAGMRNLDTKQNIGQQNTVAGNNAAVANRANQNQIAQNVYDNQLQKLNIAGGQSAQRTNQNLANTAQQNLAVGSLASGVASGINAYGNKVDTDQQRADSANAAKQAQSDAAISMQRQREWEAEQRRLDREATAAGYKR
jgi:hypothetical protein